MKRKLFSLILLVSLALAGLAGCARKADSSFGLLDIAELKLKLDFDRYVVRPVSGQAAALPGILKKLSV